MNNINQIFFTLLSNINEKKKIIFLNNNNLIFFTLLNNINKVLFLFPSFTTWSTGGWSQ